MRYEGIVNICVDLPENVHHEQDRRYIHGPHSTKCLMVEAPSVVNDVLRHASSGMLKVNV